MPRRVLLVVLTLFCAVTLPLSECKRQNRIIRGQPASAMEFPSLVVLRALSKGVMKVVCTGTLLDRLHVLSAAHCFKVYRRRDRRTPVQAVLGATSLRNLHCQENVQRIPVYQMFLKEEYISQLRMNPRITGSAFDIMILRLEYPANLTNNIKPVNLPKGNIPLRDQILSVRCIVVGYGYLTPTRKPTGLQKGRMEAVFKPGPVFEAMPAGIRKPSGCIADSGGPLFCLKNSYARTLIQVGILSVGKRRYCGMKNESVGFVNPGFYMSWIFDKLTHYR